MRDDERGERLDARVISRFPQVIAIGYKAFQLSSVLVWSDTALT
jgi:hypothetical protein